MKKIGIVGGVAWPSTMAYYSAICHRSERWHLARNPLDSPPIPEMAIESLDLTRAVAYLGNDDSEHSWSRFEGYHRAALQRLEASGADFALIASNTPHHRFDAIVHGVGIPVINILEVVARECARMGVVQLLMLGTAPTMRSQVFREGFAKHRIEAIGPVSESTRLLTVALIADMRRHCAPL